ncbi:hypothetical protein D9619_001730 [Psilocybe cf. subviscida]|uniref:SAM domain-containing protein n=1 Tax=Psilocybe cf. subviscida TaxID=2480587 RepID=A0A8H5F3S5_9AGAR|nr:hypothetical protein D9619_001730 [Psilocybe cf. subviscida]
MSTIETTPQPPVSVDDATTTTPASGQAGAPAAQSGLEGFENWIKDFKKYESILGQVSKATKDTKFKDELKTIEQWFKLLNESERTASLYTLLQHSTQDQARFYVAILQRIIKPEEVAPVAPLPTPEVKPKLGKLSFRGPSLNIDALDSPLTPTPAKEDTHVNALADATKKRQDTPDVDSNWSNVGNTPIASSFQKDKAAESSSTASLPGFPGINPYTLNMLANAGLSTEAQLLAAQLVMSGIVQPTGLAAATSAKPKKAPQSPWRTTAPLTARFPSSALRSSGLRPSSGLKSAGLKGSSLAQPQTPLSAMESPREEDFNPEMLKDIPGWLRTLRLHKYTQCFDGLSWEEMVVLDDATLEAKGIAALGARRRLLRTFEHVRKVMGIDEPSSATPTTTTMPTGPAFKAASEGAADRVPHSAVPLTRSKLSINSPIFTPTWEQGKLPTSATPEDPAEASAEAPTPLATEAAAVAPV